MYKLLSANSYNSYGQCCGSGFNGCHLIRIRNPDPGSRKMLDPDPKDSINPDPQHSLIRPSRAFYCLLGGSLVKSCWLKRRMKMILQLVSSITFSRCLFLVTMKTFFLFVIVYVIVMFAVHMF